MTGAANAREVARAADRDQYLPLGVEEIAVLDPDRTMPSTCGPSWRQARAPLMGHRHAYAPHHSPLASVLAEKPAARLMGAAAQ